MKLSGWTIFFCCVFIGAIPLLWVLFQVYMPYEAAAKNMRDYQASLEAEAGKQGAAVKRVEKAIAKVQAASVAWNRYALYKTPANSLAGNGIDIYENPYQLVVDSPKFRNSAQRAFNAQLHMGGVKILGAPEIPPPSDSEKDILASFYNYPAFSFPVVVWELGSVTVTGTYSQISANVRAWTNMPHYLAVVDGLRIDGTSPNLTASYNVTIVGFIASKNPNVYPPPIVDIGTASSTSGSGGGPGGPSGAPPAIGKPGVGGPVGGR